LRILFIGDVVGRPGRRLLVESLPSLIEDLSCDVVVANGENAAGGAGITEQTADEIFRAGVDVITTGNHVWDRREVEEYIRTEPRLLRPLNFPRGVPGRGLCLMEKGRFPPLAVINAHGRSFMDVDFDCPFRAVDDVLPAVTQVTPLVLIDFHAEATSEKQAFAWHFDGRVSAVMGTHTHVQTADARVLPGGTAYVTDVGMVGPQDAVLGMEVESVVERFRTQMPIRFNVARTGPRMLNAMVITLDQATGKALDINAIFIRDIS